MPKPISDSHIDFCKNKISIGIILCPFPQISAHIPFTTPQIGVLKINSDNRPGTASSFTPKQGMKNECKTSAEVTKIRIKVALGKIKELSTSNSRKFPTEGNFIKESKL